VDHLDEGEDVGQHRSLRAKEGCRSRAQRGQRSGTVDLCGENQDSSRFFSTLAGGKREVILQVRHFQEIKWFGKEIGLAAGQAFLGLKPGMASARLAYSFVIEARVDRVFQRKTSPAIPRRVLQFPGLQR